MLDLSALNENQRKAVLWDDGPLLVLAGPGSGKTRVLTSRIARILEESSGQHFCILAFTFTNKVAAEMRAKVEELVPDEFSRVHFGTFHSYAEKLLRQHGSHQDIRSDFLILSNDADRETFLEDVIRLLRKDLTYPLPDHFTAKQLLPAITSLLEQCIPVDQAETKLQREGNDNAIPLARVYKSYKETLHRRNFLDFPSLIAKSIELLSHPPALDEHIRKIYYHILVDEFQDISRSQYRFLSLITQPDPSTLFVVADDDQIIYQWNGASPERISELRKDFGVSDLQLPENYRCPPQVIKLANALIEKTLNRSVGKKPSKAVKQGGGAEILRVYSFESIEEEAKWIAQDISNKEHSQWRNCAVLARTKKLLDLARKELAEAGVPVYYAARKGEFTSAPLRMLHSILRLADSREDRQSLARLSKAFYDLESIRIDPAPVLSNASADGKDLLRSWIDEVLRRDTLEKETKELLETGTEPLLNTLNYRHFSDKLFQWAEICQKVTSPAEEVFNEFGDERNVWEQLLEEISRKFAGEDPGLHQLLHELDLISKTPPKPPEAVPCFTIHASKGMEFRHVYLMGLVEDQLPSWAAVKKGDDSFQMQEERRNCFVAITRTQKTLTMTYSKELFGWPKAPSRFLTEMGIEDL